MLIDDPLLRDDIVSYVQHDLRKLTTLITIYNANKTNINRYIINNIFQIKLVNDDTREITKNIINRKYNLEDHNNVMNETDRTTIGLLFHENIIDVLEKEKKQDSIPIYMKLLDNICFADYIDRITFQKQIWLFNELTSLIKTFKNNKILHEELFATGSTSERKKRPRYNPSEVRFTKILTKYSTEFNNVTFINNLCQELSMDKKDLFAFFIHLRDIYGDNEALIYAQLENYDITKLDCSRIYRYLSKITSYLGNVGACPEEIGDED